MAGQDRPSACATSQRIPASAPVRKRDVVRDLGQPPEVVADPCRAVVEAREMRVGPASVRIGPVGPAQPACRRLGHAEQEIARRPCRAEVAGVVRDGVGGKKAGADRRRADVPVGVMVRRLHRRPPRRAALRHRPAPCDERVRRHAHDLDRGSVGCSRWPLHCRRRRDRRRRSRGNGAQAHEDDEAHSFRRRPTAPASDEDGSTVTVVLDEGIGDVTRCLYLRHLPACELRRLE